MLTKLWSLRFCPAKRIPSLCSFDLLLTNCNTCWWVYDELWLSPVWRVCEGSQLVNRHYITMMSLKITSSNITIIIYYIPCFLNVSFPSVRLTEMLYFLPPPRPSVFVSNDTSSSSSSCSPFGAVEDGGDTWPRDPAGLDWPVSPALSSRNIWNDCSNRSNSLECN